MERKIEKSINKDEKRLYTLAKELDIIGIEQIEKIYHHVQAQRNAQSCKKLFIQNPSLSTFKRFLNSMEGLNIARKDLSNVLLRKLEKQNEFVNCFNSLRHLDEKEIEDLKRALLTDFAISFTAGQAFFMATPLEMLLKSGKLAEKAQIDFLSWSGHGLYMTCAIIKNRQRDYSLWLTNLLRSIESRQ